MRVYAKVFLLLTLVSIVESRPKKKPVDLCTIPVVLLMERSTCDPLMKLWVLRRGTCREARQCIKGYSKDECEKYCIRNRKKETTTIKPTKPSILQTRSTCVFTFGEEEVTMTSPAPKNNDEGSPHTITTEGPRTRRTRRTRKPYLC